MTKTLLLDDLLLKSADYLPNYGKGFSVHLPMALCALDRFGAHETVLQGFFDEDVASLIRFDASVTPPAIADVAGHLGDERMYPAYLQFFRRQIAADGRVETIRKFVPQVLPGIGGSAFHALIRLAYAIEAESDSETAAALAYWCSGYRAPDLQQQRTPLGLKEILSKVAPLGVGYDYAPGIIIDRMMEASGLLAASGEVLQPERISLPELAQLCLRAFACHNDFTLLHTVTCCHAFRLLSPCLDDEEAGFRALWQAILTAWLSTGLAVPDDMTGICDSAGDFAGLTVRARASRDAHVIKVVYSSWQEAGHYGDPLYFHIASRALEEAGL